MQQAHKEYSWVMIPTTDCNAQCQYCFQKKTHKNNWSLEDMRIIFEKMRIFAIHNHIGKYRFYWQGGEIMMLGTSFFDDAAHIQAQILANIEISNSIQTNLLAYNKTWGRVIKKYFRGIVSTSVDYPNLYRRIQAGGNAEYMTEWQKRYARASDDGIRVNVISIPNEESIKIGAKAFLDYFANRLKVKGLQINLAFPINGGKTLKSKFYKYLPSLNAFMKELAVEYLHHYETTEFALSPIREIMRTMRGECLWQGPCIFAKCCASQFMTIGPRGECSVCDCWLDVGKDRIFGNVLTDDIDELIRHPFRNELFERTESIINKECRGCDYLHMCYGGCPIRAYSFKNNLRSRDFYCSTYKQIFTSVKENIEKQRSGA